MSATLITQDKTSSTAASSLTVTLNISSPSAEKAIAIYSNNNFITSVTVDGVSASAIGSGGFWYGITGITNGSKVVTVNYTGLQTAKIWAGAFAGVYQTNGFVILNDYIACNSTGTTLDFVYSTADPTSDSSPSVGYRPLNGLFNTKSTDGSFTANNPGCTGLGYAGNVPYSTLDNLDSYSVYDRINLTNSAISATATNGHGSSYAGRDFEGSTTMTMAFNEFIWIVSGDGALIPNATQMIII